MANAILNGKHGYDITAEVPDCSYYVALIGSDGMLIPRSELSNDFDSPSAAFSALEMVVSTHPNAGVFGRTAAA